jgi:hypothetical protein
MSIQALVKVVRRIIIFKRNSTGKRNKINFNVLTLDSKLCIAVGKEFDEQVAVIFEEVTNSDGKMLYADCIERVNQIMIEICNKYLPKKTRDVQHKDWFNTNETELLQLMHERSIILNKYRNALDNKVIRDQLKPALLQARRIIQARCRSMQNDYLEKEADQMKEVFDKRGANGYFELLGKIFGRSKQALASKLLKLDGSFTKTDDEKMYRWIEHFKLLLNQESIVNDSYRLHLPTQRNVKLHLDDPFIVIEVLQAMNDMKGDKAR